MSTEVILYRPVSPLCVGRGWGLGLRKRISGSEVKDIVFQEPYLHLDDEILDFELML